MITIAPARAAGLALLLLGACRAHTTTSLGVGLRGPIAACAGASSLDVAGVVERTRGAIVRVIAGRASEITRVFSEHGGGLREHALGSGVLLTSDGLVLTSRHVIVGADDVRVELSDGRSFRGSVIARDAWLDIALIQIRGASGLPIAELGSSDAMSVGDPVLAIGNPFGLGPSVTRGILSAKGRSIDDGPSQVFLQTDAAVNPGDSGGPLLDAGGRVIGINAAVMDRGQGLSFAVPIDDVRAAFAELLATGRVARGHAGITYQAVDAPIARALSLPGQGGVIVTELDAGGPASRAGMRAGDVITTIDDRSLGGPSELAHALGRRRPGEVVRFGVLHAGKQITARVMLDRLPADDDDARRDAPLHAKRVKALGLKTADADGGGARIDELDPDTRAADDLRPGDVVVEIDHRPVNGAADLGRALDHAARPSTVLLRVRRADTFLYVGLDLD